MSILGLVLSNRNLERPFSFHRGSFNNYVDKKRGKGVSRKFTGGSSVHENCNLRTCCVHKLFLF